jgi:hypothetical protein
MSDNERQDSEIVDQPEVAEGGIDAALESTVAVSEDDGTGSRPLGLDIATGNQVAAKRRPTVLILAGGVETGKTSIYAALYERFGRGPFAGRLFAGSETIPGFEKRCHGWRVQSGDHDPLMEHTALTDLHWLHMRIRDSERQRCLQDLLFVDYNGEIFADIASGTSSESDRTFLRRGDHVGVVLDGGKLCDPTQRKAALQRSSYLVDELMEPGVLAGPKALFVLISKFDLLAAASEEEREAAEDVAVKVSELIKERADTHDAPILRVAARSESDLFPLGHGLSELLDLMTERPALYVRNDPPGVPAGDAFTGFTA